MLQLDNVTNGKSLIIDEKGNVIYDSMYDRMATNIENDRAISKAAGNEGSFYDEREGVNRLYIYATSPNTGWKVITSIPVSELTKDTSVIRNVTWITTGVAIIVAIIISTVLSLAITKPLRKMTRLMRTVQEGNFNVQFQVKHRDEVGQLGNQFNRMITRIDQLIQDIYEMETKKKKAELQTLQNQINPHFMYNTLESIRMAAELNDDTDAADMIAILGKLLRYSISDLHEESSLADELLHVRNYVEMLNYRYPNRFKLHIACDEEHERYAVIKLMLQPIVENAIYHGLDDSKPAMRITIASERAGSVLLVRIIDDGIGIEQAALTRLNESLAEGTAPGADRKQGGIGLKNVNERIKLHYGQGYGLFVNSAPGAGTEVVLRLPIESRSEAK